MLIDEQMPAWEVGEIHASEVLAPPEACWRAVRTTDFRQSWIIRTLFRMRGLSSDLGDLDSFIEEGFELVAEAPGREVVLGLAGGVRGRRLVRFPMPASGLTAFDAPGVIVIAWNFTVEPQGPAASRVRTETRVRATSPGVRAAFRAYWFIVGPFSALIRRRMLALIGRAAMRGA